MSLPPDLVRALQESFATAFIGFAVATTIYGITVLQGYIYFRNYWRDHALLKVTVAVLLVLDTLSTILVAHSLYTNQVLNFGNPLADLLIPWSFAAENGALAAITFIVQSYFAERLWRFSHNKVLVIAIGVFAAVALGLGIKVTVNLFTTPTIASLSTRAFLVIAVQVIAAAAICDVLITVGLCFYLQRARTGVKETKHILDSLTIYAINRGALTTITQVVYLVLYVAFPARTIWQPFHQSLGKLYVNSLLATLNARKSLNGHDSESCGDKNFKSIHLSRIAHQSGCDEQTTGQGIDIPMVRDVSGHGSRVLSVYPSLRTLDQTGEFPIGILKDPMLSKSDSAHTL